MRICYDEGEGIMGLGHLTSDQPIYDVLSSKTFVETLKISIDKKNTGRGSSLI